MSGGGTYDGSPLPPAFTYRWMASQLQSSESLVKVGATPSLTPSPRPSTNCSLLTGQRGYWSWMDGSLAPVAVKRGKLHTVLP